MRRISCIGSIPVLLLFLLASPSNTQAQSDSPPSSPLTDPDGVPDHTSVLSCSFPFLNYVSVSYDSMLPCTIITKSNGVETEASLGDFVIVVQNHTGLHDLKEGVGYISNITLLDGMRAQTKSGDQSHRMYYRRLTFSFPFCTPAQLSPLSPSNIIPPTGATVN